MWPAGRLLMVGSQTHVEGWVLISEGGPADGQVHKDFSYQPPSVTHPHIHLLPPSLNLSHILSTNRYHPLSPDPGMGEPELCPQQECQVSRMRPGSQGQEPAKDQESRKPAGQGEGPPLGCPQVQALGFRGRPEHRSQVLEMVDQVRRHDSGGIEGPLGKEADAWVLGDALGVPKLRKGPQSGKRPLLC